MDKKRIVITGIGVVSPIGIGKDEFWQGLKDSHSGIRPISLFDTSDFRSKLAGEVTDFKPEEILGSKGLRNLDRNTLLLSSAAKLAIDDAKLIIDGQNTDDIGVVTGTTLSAVGSIAEFGREIIEQGPRFANPAIFPSTVVNAASSQVSIKFNIQGLNTTISTGFTASLDALKYAITAIESDKIKIALVAGVESLTIQNFIAFYNIGFLAGKKGPELSCPFDKRRNGIIFGEGAGVIVIESIENARQRGAPILAEIKSVSTYFDAYRSGKHHPTAEGLTKSINACLAESKIKKEDIDCISASANATKQQDKLEAEVLKNIFNGYSKKIPISAIKSIIGESFSAAGIFQIAASVWNIKTSSISRNLNYQEKDSDCELNYLSNPLINKKLNNILIDNFGPGGNNAATIISRFT